MPPIAAAPPSLDGMSEIKHSVVRSIAAIEAAFCRAERVTLAGSTIPAAIISSYTSVKALKPVPLGEL